MDENVRKAFGRITRNAYATIATVAAAMTTVVLVSLSLGIFGPTDSLEGTGANLRAESRYGLSGHPTEPVEATTLLPTSKTLLITGAAFQAQAPRAQAPNGSRKDVVAALLRREGGPVYTVLPHHLARARYARTIDRLLIDLVVSPLGPPNVEAELPASNDLVKSKFPAGFTASVVIVSCGDIFGDADSCDQYSDLKEPMRIGNQIESSDVAEYSRVIQSLARLLK